MLDARTTGNFATRRPAERPSHIAVRLLDEDQNVTVENVDRSEAPGFLVLPMFEQAGAIAGRPPTPGINVSGMELIGFGADPAKLARERGAVGLQAQVVPEIEAFCCLLAKIAYS
jgi:hypothetical protein